MVGERRWGLKVAGFLMVAVLVAVGGWRGYERLLVRLANLARETISQPPGVGTFMQTVYEQEFAMAADPERALFGHLDEFVSAAVATRRRGLIRARCSTRIAQAHGVSSAAPIPAKERNG